MNHFLTSRLSAHAGTRSAELIVQADAIGEAIRSAIAASERAILKHTRAGPLSYYHNYKVALAHLELLPEQIWHSLRIQLAKLLYWSHDRAAEALIATLPRPYLRAAYAAKRVPESAERQLAGERRLLEHGPIVFNLGLDANKPQFGTQDLAMSAPEEADMWRRFLFPPPPADYVRSLLDRLLPPRTVQGTLFDMIGTDANQRPPVGLAAEIATRYSNGESTAAIGRFIRPYFDGSAMRAERTARTLGAYIGSSQNFATSEALGEMVAGYQVQDPGGPTARPAHALRSGTIYYRHPKPGQYGMDVMPHPPQDTQRGPHDDMEAPRGLCYNCRCWTSPVLAPLPAMQTPAFTDAKDRYIPAPAHFSDWFNGATESQRRAAAGAGRLAAATDTLRREPYWSELIDPQTGALLSVDQLRRETEAERVARRARVESIIARNRAALRQVAAFGSAT